MKRSISQVLVIGLSVFSLCVFASNPSLNSKASTSNESITASQPDSLYQRYQVSADNLYRSMSVDQRIGQLVLPSYILLANSVSKDGSACKKAVNSATTSTQPIIKACGLDLIAKYHLGAVLTSGGPFFNAPTLKNWATLNALATGQHHRGNKLDPVLLTGNDAIHGNMHVQGAVMFPQNIGLGVTHNPKLVHDISVLVGQDSLASGFNWVYMPTVAIAQDLRWGRTYESFGQDPQLVKALARAYVSGLQNIQQNKITGPIATAKHFIGDGATQYGFDEGDDAYTGNEKMFWQKNGVGYEGALQVNVATIMASYSAIDDAHTCNNTRMHFGGRWDIINQFKNFGIQGSDGQLYRFQGFIVSDFNAPTRSAYFYALCHNRLTLPEIMAKTINAGVDMIMVGEGDTTDPFDLQSTPNYTNVAQVVDAVKTAYQQGLISHQRLKEAVTRILAVKLAMAAKVPQDYASLQAQQRKLALQAAQQSLVLLKNNNRVLPINRNAIKNVIFVGDTNDLGLQNGGWTVNWQGQKGDQYFTGEDKITSGATTLEEGIQKALNAQKVHYYHVNAEQVDQLPHHLNGKNSLVVALVSEVPYAEFMGDIGNSKAVDDWYKTGATNRYNNYLGLPQSQFLGLKFNETEAAAIHQLKKRGIPVVTVVYSGRPVILRAGGKAAPFNNSDAVIAAFLPGTLGGKALSNAIFGAYCFRSGAHGQSNTLTFPWPANMRQVADHFSRGALFPIGYGLSDC